jgi:hypothetical protein
LRRRSRTLLIARMFSIVRAEARGDRQSGPAVTGPRGFPASSSRVMGCELTPPQPALRATSQFQQQVSRFGGLQFQQRVSPDSMREKEVLEYWRPCLLLHREKVTQRAG